MPTQSSLLRRFLSIQSINDCRSRRDRTSVSATTVLLQEMRSWTRSVLLICIEAIAWLPMPLVVLLSIYFNKSKGIHQRISQSKQNMIRTGMEWEVISNMSCEGYESFIICTKYERDFIDSDDFIFSSKRFV